MSAPRFFFFAGILFLLSAPALAQNDFSRELNRILDAGIIGGANYSKITSVEKIIISEPYFINGNGYHLTNHWIPGFTLGAFVNYSFHLGDEPDLKSNWFVYLESAYSREGSKLQFDNDSLYYYHIKFSYDYVNFLALFGGKYGAGYFGVGPAFSLNASPRNIYFTSWGAGKRNDFGTDISQQQQLRNALYGKSNFGIVVAAGCQVQRQLDIEGRFYYGCKDIIEVQPNSYNWTQQQNHAITAQLVLKVYLTRRERIREDY